MSFNNNIKTHKIQFALTDSNKESNEESNTIPTKTYQSNSFSQKRNNYERLERIRLANLEKGKKLISTLRGLSKQDSLFITLFKEDEINKNKEKKTIIKNEALKPHIPHNKIQSNVSIIKEYNVFENEDDIIKKIMYQFYVYENVKRPSKIVQKRTALDKIYGISPSHKNSLKNAKKKKYLSLEEYQNNILTSFSQYNKNIDQGKFIDLVQNMKDLRIDSESVAPLPKINFKTIKEHVLSKGTKNLKQMSIKEYLSKNKKPKDQFEKENILITKMMTQRGGSHFIRNKRNKNLDNLPQYLRDLFNSQIKYHG